MKQHKYILLISCVLFIFLGIVLDAQEYSVTHYDVKDGMSSGPKKCIIEDSEGFLWIGSTSGLNRFDGKDFKIYTGDITDSTSFSTYHFRSFLIDPYDNLWVCMEEGIYLYDRKKDRFFCRSLRLPLQYEMPIPGCTDFIFIDDKLYITSIGGLFIYDIKEDVWRFVDLKPDKTIKGWHHSAKSVWILEQDIFDSNIINVFGLADYVKFDINSNKVLQHCKIPNKRGDNATAKHIKQIDKDRFWLATNGAGLLKFNRESEKTEYQLLNENQVLNLVFQRTGEFVEIEDDVLLLTELNGDCLTFNTKTYQWQKFWVDGIKNKYKHAIKDKFGTIWLAGKSGLTKIEKQVFTIVDIPNKKDVAKYGCEVTSDGRFAMITTIGPEHELYEIDSLGAFHSTGWKRNTWGPAFNRLTNQFYYFDRDSMFVFDPLENKITKSYFLKDVGYFEFITFWKDKIYVTKDAMITMLDSNGVLLKKWNTKEIDVMISPRTLDQVTVKNDSIIYFHNANEIIEINTLSDYMKRIPLASTKMVVKNLFVINNDLWLPNKFNTLIQLKWDSITKEYQPKNIFNSNHLENVGASIIDSNGIIWLCTYNGLKAVDTKNGEVVLNIDGRDGLNNFDDFVNVTKRGIYLNTLDDIIWISNDLENQKMRTISINEFQIKGEKVTIEKSYDVKYDQNDLNIKWQLPYLGRYDQLSFYFKLEGHDEEWHYNENHNSAYYSNLSPGEYSFKVKAMCLGEESFSNLFDIIINPPWWKTIWFYGICILFLSLSIFYFYKNKLKKATSKANLDKKIAQLEIKALRAQLNPHFIFNSLNSVKSLIQCDEKDQAVEYLVLFAIMIRRVLDMSDAESVSLHEELEFSSEYLRLESLRLGSQFSYDIDVDESIDLDFVLVPPMILQPHLENAIWHGIMQLEKLEGHISIRIKDEKEIIRITLDDNGIGRKASEIINKSNADYKHNPKGTSLSIDRIKLRSLSEDQEISIVIKDKYDGSSAQGTSVIINLTK